MARNPLYWHNKFEAVEEEGQEWVKGMDDSFISYVRSVPKAYWLALRFWFFYLMKCLEERKGEN